METKTIKNSDKITTAQLKLTDGWQARVALNAPDGSKLTQSQWHQCLTNPSDLLKNPVKVLKNDGSNTVIVKNLNIAEKNLPVVVKLNTSKSGFQSFFRSIPQAKSVRNFSTATRLCENNIPTAYPLAALEQKSGFLTKKSIYITQYLNDSRHLYGFIGDIPKEKKHDLNLRKQLSSQIAGVLAGLDKAGLWHRDAKAPNFLVKKDLHGNYKILLVDMDGIKRYFFNRKSKRFTAFSKLASTLMWSGSISKTDYLRTFAIYCKITDLNKTDQRQIYPSLIRQAVAIRLLTMANSMIEKRGIIVEDN